MSKYLRVILVAVMMGCFAIGCQQQQQPQGMTEEEARLLLDKYTEIMNEGNVDRVDEVFDKNCVLKYPVLPEPMVGVQALKDFIPQNAVTFPDFHGVIEEVMVKGDIIWSRYTVTATQLGPLGELPPTGRTVQFTGMAITRVANGKIIEDETFWNVLAFYQQLGFTLMPPEVGTE